MGIHLEKIPQSDIYATSLRPRGSPPEMIITSDNIVPVYSLTIGDNFASYDGDKCIPDAKTSASVVLMDSHS